jgi:transposase-like protein
VIVLAVCWYLRFGLSYRDVEELLARRGIEVDHVTIYRWVQRFTPLLADAARPCRHAVGDRWQADETYVKVAGRWRYVYRAIDQFGQVIDVFVSPRREVKAARRFFERAIGTTKRAPVEVITDKAAAYPAMLEELLPGAWHRTDRYANNHYRGRPRSSQGEAASDARAQAGPQRQGRDRRACLGPERSSWALRAGGRSAGQPARGGRVRRARLGDLTPAGYRRFSMPPDSPDATVPVLVTAGVSALLTAAAYELVDRGPGRSWARPLVTLGSNALALYAASVLLFAFLLKPWQPALVRPLAAAGGASFAAVAYAAGTVLVAWALAEWLYGRRLFAKV